MRLGLTSAVRSTRTSLQQPGHSILSTCLPRAPHAGDEALNDRPERVCDEPFASDTLPEASSRERCYVFFAGAFARRADRSVDQMELELLKDTARLNLSMFEDSSILSCVTHGFSL